jgi:hypothetical protein
MGWSNQKKLDPKWNKNIYVPTLSLFTTLINIFTYLSKYLAWVGRQVDSSVDIWLNKYIHGSFALFINCHMTPKCNVTCVNWKHHLLDGWDIFLFLK